MKVLSNNRDARSCTHLILVAFILTCTQLSATTFTVTNNNDSGAGSLRQAILDSNGNPGADVINFDNNYTILLNSLLPDIAKPFGDLLTIDGGSNIITDQDIIHDESINICVQLDPTVETQGVNLEIREN